MDRSWQFMGQLVGAEGSITSVLGANGAGKTTVLKTISGAMEPLKVRWFYLVMKSKGWILT